MWINIVQINTATENLFYVFAAVAGIVSANDQNVGSRIIKQ